MYQDDPDYRVYLGCLQSLYPNTILGQDIAGSIDSIKNYCKGFKNNFDYFYRPENCHLVLIGNFDIEQIYRFVKETRSEFTISHKTVEKKSNPLRRIFKS